VTNVNNNQVIAQNGRFTVQNTNAAMSSAPDCPPQYATVVLGPFPMQKDGARIPTAFEPCIPTNGTVILNPSDKQGIQLGSKYSGRTNKTISCSSYAENNTNSASTDFI
jgi:hypothetical protein